jgi:hypothetical protein
MGNIHQLTVRDELRKGKPGMLADISQNIDESNLPHNVDKAKEVWYVEVESGDPDTDYEYSVNGEPVKITTDGSVADLEEVAAALRDAHNDNPITRGLAVATISDIDTGSDSVKETVVLTATWPNVDLDVASEDANLTVSENTDAGEVEAIKPGLALYNDGGQGTLVNPGSGLDNMVGITAFTYDEAPDTIGTSEMEYSSPRPVNYIRSGRVYVSGGDDASFGDAVWVGQDADERGEFFTADNSGNTREQADTGDMRWYDANIIEIRLGL